MPPIPREARTREASYERLSYVACRSELVLVDWIDRLAVTGVASHHDIDTFERATMILWRLTSIRKSLDARSQNPNSPDLPDPTKLETELLTDLAALSTTGSADVPSAPPPADQSAPPSPTCNEPQPPNNEQQTPANEPSHNPQSTIRNPQSSAAPCVPPAGIRAVPTCPTLSPQGVETFLARNEAAFAKEGLAIGSADALVRNPALASQPAPPSANASSSTLDSGHLTLDDAPVANPSNPDDNDDDYLSADEDPFKPAPCGGNCMECLKNQTCEACTVENPPDMNDPPERDALLRWMRRRKRASPP